MRTLGTGGFGTDCRADRHHPAAMQLLLQEADERVALARVEALGAAGRGAERRGAIDFAPRRAGRLRRLLRLQQLADVAGLNFSASSACALGFRLCLGLGLGFRDRFRLRVRLGFRFGFGERLRFGLCFGFGFGERFGLGLRLGFRLGLSLLPRQGFRLLALDELGRLLGCRLFLRLATRCLGTSRRRRRRRRGGLDLLLGGLHLGGTGRRRRNVPLRLAGIALLLPRRRGRRAGSAAPASLPWRSFRRA